MHAARRGAAALGIALTLTTPLALATPTTADAATITATKKPVKKPAKKPVKKVTYRWYDLADYKPTSRSSVSRVGSLQVGGQTGPSAIKGGNGSSAVWAVNSTCTAVRGYAGHRTGSSTSQIQVQILADTTRAYTKVFGKSEGEDFNVSLKGAKKLTIGFTSVAHGGGGGIISTQVYCSKAPGQYDPA